MKTPLEIVFEHVDPSPSVEAMIRCEARKLERHFGRITSCRVAFGRPTRNNGTQHDPFQVRIHVTLPGQPDVAVTQCTGEHGLHDAPQAAVRDAFSAALRQLDARIKKMKSHRA